MNDLDLMFLDNETAEYQNDYKEATAVIENVNLLLNAIETFKFTPRIYNTFNVDGALEGLISLDQPEDEVLSILKNQLKQAQLDQLDALEGLLGNIFRRIQYAFTSDKNVKTELRSMITKLKSFDSEQKQQFAKERISWNGMDAKAMTPVVSFVAAGAELLVKYMNEYRAKRKESKWWQVIARAKAHKEVLLSFKAAGLAFARKYDVEKMLEWIKSASVKNKSFAEANYTVENTIKFVEAWAREFDGVLADIKRLRNMVDSERMTVIMAGKTVIVIEDQSWIPISDIIYGVIHGYTRIDYTLWRINKLVNKM